MNFIGIGAEEIPTLAGQLIPLIEKPLQKMDAAKYFTAEHVIEKCLSRDWQCWVAGQGRIDAIFITYIDMYPTGYKTLTIFLIGGEKMPQWFDMGWDILKRFGQAHGCKEIIGLGRKGWIRALKDKGEINERLNFAVKI